MVLNCASLFLTLDRKQGEVLNGAEWCFIIPDSRQETDHPLDTLDTLVFIESQH
jgi:hypothetical protein